MTYKKKLIEVALPLGTLNREAVREKNVRMGHPSTLHLWWARRPLSIARIVLFASLVDDPSAHPDRFPTLESQAEERHRLFGIVEELVRWENSNNQQVLAAARAEIIASCDGELPNILDPFSGGGTIPLEAQRLGLPSYGGDLNPVAVLISKALVEVPPRFADLPPVHPMETDREARLSTWDGAQGLAEDIRHYGAWMREQAKAAIGHHYPDVWRDPVARTGKASVVAWIWARTVESPDPSWDGHVPLVRSWVLRKPGKGRPTVWIRPVVDRHTETIRFNIEEGGDPPGGTVGRQGATCLVTGTPIPFDYIRQKGVDGEMGQQLIAIVADAGTGRFYLEPSLDHEHAAEAVKADWEPTSEMPAKALGFRVQAYGMTRHSQLFTQRQLKLMTTYSDVLTGVRQRIEGDALTAGLKKDNVRLRDAGAGAAAYADAVVTYLALGIDRLADISNAFCRWEASRTQVRNLFARQTIPMVWDFAEANPFGGAAGDFAVSLESIAKVVERLPARGHGEILQRDARARIKEVSNPVISMDPPYYDNIGYADLSDFFYIWMRRNLQEVWPDELSTLLTPKSEELIASPFRAGSRDAARMYFEMGMRDVFEAVASAQNTQYPATVFYAYKQKESDESGVASTGWETFLEALLGSGFAVSATWPVRTELIGALKKNMAVLASSVVIAIRPRAKDAPLATRSEFLAALRSELPDALYLLQRESIAPVDMAQSAIGPGMAVFSRYAKVIEADGTLMSVRQALVLINEVLQEVLSEEETEFDGDTRWALTWFDQFGLNPGPYGDAETLSKAKNTSVAGVTQAGIATQLDGKVRLLDRDELESEWDPASDKRLTVWEVTQHLISGLDESESSAADLLRQAGGGMGERARQLAYLLYQVADRRGWAEEAVAYNSLVQAWPEISKLAGRSEAPMQQVLGE